MQERGNKGENSGLVTSSCARAGKNARDLSHERATDPEASGLIEKVSHLGSHVAKARRCAEDKGVVIAEFFWRSSGCGLIHLCACRACDIIRHQLRDAFERDLYTINGSRPFRNGLGHGFYVAIHGIIEN